MTKSILLHLTVAGILLLVGCGRFKPVVQNTRYFLLTPAAAEQRNSAVQDAPSIGVGAVTLPGYLLQNRIAVRRGNSEIQYSDNLRWAERLDKNVQRVFGSNLGAFLGSTNVYLSTWHREEVDAELYLTLNRFDLDENGTVTLEATWLISAPGSAATQRSGPSRISRQGPPLSTNPDEAVATLSAALSDLAREIADALSEPSG